MPAAPCPLRAYAGLAGGTVGCFLAMLVAIVTMDSHGNSLHADVEKSSGEALEALQKV